MLDTNVVLSALLFTSGRLAWIRLAWQHGQIVPLLCEETTRELIRVLAYPKFKLDTEARQELLESFIPYAEIVQLPKTLPKLPTCRDPHDEVFLALAKVGKADAVITEDEDLLVLKSAFQPAILTPEEFHQLHSN